MTDTLFHAWPEPAFKNVSADTTHGDHLGDCKIDDPSASGNVQVRAWNLSVDHSFTGLALLNVDTAVYYALNLLWNGNRAQAISIIQSLIADTRATQPDDPVFWDPVRKLLVDSSSRCWYSKMLDQCTTCTCVPDLPGLFPQATFKLALVLYAARLLGLANDPTLYQPLFDMWTQLWNAQNTDGGMAHAALYDAFGTLQSTTSQNPNGLVVIGSTGEATASTIIAHTAQTLP